MKKILALSGSTRKNSTNENILKAVESFLPQDWEMEMKKVMDALIAETGE